MTDVLKYDGPPDDVAAILVSILERDGDGLSLKDPSEQLEDLTIVLCETMPIAMVKHVEDDRFMVTHLACYQPVHGVHPKLADLTDILKSFSRADRVPATCPMCDGTEWLRVGGEEARTGAAFAISLGVFRGVELPKTEELEQLRQVAVEKAFSNILEHPSIARIKEELGQNGDTGSGQ